MKIKSILYLLVSFLICFTVIGAYQFDNFKVSKVDYDFTDVTKQIDNEYIMDIESINKGEKFIEIDGWAIDKGKMYKYFNWVIGEGEGVYNNNTVVLQDQDGELYKINTISEVREDVNTKINDGLNYNKCGFKALVKRSKLKEGCTYKVGVILTTLDKEKKLIMSKKEIVL